MMASTTWKVQITDEAAKILGSKDLSPTDHLIIQEWAKLVVRSGPGALLRRPDIWADHPLHGKWQGYRASSFSFTGRIIYRIEERIITLIVVRITPDHDYKKNED